MPLYGLASDGVYHARPVTRPAVRSYRPFSPLPDSLSSGLFSVALSLRLPPLDVIQHPDPVKPGLSSHLPFKMLAKQLSNSLNIFVVTCFVFKIKIDYKNRDA